MCGAGRPLGSRACSDAEAAGTGVVQTRLQCVQPAGQRKGQLAVAALARTVSE